MINIKDMLLGPSKFKTEAASFSKNNTPTNKKSIINTVVENSQSSSQEKNNNEFRNEESTYLIESDITINEVNSFLSECNEYDSNYKENKDSFCYQLLSFLCTYKTENEFKLVSMFIKNPKFDLLKEYIGNNILTFDILDKFLSEIKNNFIKKIYNSMLIECLDDYILGNPNIKTINVKENLLLKPNFEKYTYGLSEKTFSSIRVFDRMMKDKFKSEFKFDDISNDTKNYIYRLGKSFSDYYSYSDYIFDLNNKKNSYISDILFYEYQTQNSDIDLIRLNYRKFSLEDIKNLTRKLAERISVIMDKEDLEESLTKNEVLEKYFTSTNTTWNPFPFFKNEEMKYIFKASSSNNYDDIKSFLFEIMLMDMLKEKGISNNKKIYEETLNINIFSFVNNFLIPNNALKQAIQKCFNELKQNDKFLIEEGEKYE